MWNWSSLVLFVVCWITAILLGQINGIPMRGTNVALTPQARWNTNGTTVAGGNGQGGGLNQLYLPHGLYVDEDQTVYVADYRNDRVVAWSAGITSGQVVVGGNGQGNRLDQLHGPADVIVDRSTDSLLICDRGNRRVVRSPRLGCARGEILLSDIDCYGLTMDDLGFLYVSDLVKHEVRRFKVGDSQGTLVAGGNGGGARYDQLKVPTNLFVDRDHSVYVSDDNNHRVMKWVEDAKEGQVVAGGHGYGSGVKQLWYPCGVLVDEMGTVYVADHNNHRIMRWPPGATEGSVVVGGNGRGDKANQLYGPVGLSFDRHGHLYVADRENYRVQKFELLSP